MLISSIYKQRFTPGTESWSVKKVVAINKTCKIKAQSRTQSCWCKTISRYFTFKTHLLSAPFIVSVTSTTAIFANINIIFPFHLFAPLPSTECDLFWFSLILIFNDTFYRSSICPIKTKGIVLGRVCARQTHVYNQQSSPADISLALD